MMLEGFDDVQTMADGRKCCQKKWYTNKERCLSHFFSLCLFPFFFAAMQCNIHTLCVCAVMPMSLLRARRLCAAMRARWGAQQSLDQLFSHSSAAKEATRVDAFKRVSPLLSLSLCGEVQESVYI